MVCLSLNDSNKDFLFGVEWEDKRLVLRQGEDDLVWLSYNRYDKLSSLITNYYCRSENAIAEMYLWQRLLEDVDGSDRFEEIKVLHRDLRLYGNYLVVINVMYLVYPGGLLVPIFKLSLGGNSRYFLKEESLFSELAAWQEEKYLEAMGCFRL